MGTNTATTPKEIKLLKAHEHQGRKYEAGIKLPIQPSQNPIAIDEADAAWLVAHEVAEFVK